MINEVLVLNIVIVSQEGEFVIVQMPQAKTKLEIISSSKTNLFHHQTNSPQVYFPTYRYTTKIGHKFIL